MSELNIKVRKLQDNGSTFRVNPETLYLGGVWSAKVDTLRFALPEEWAGCAVTLHVQRLSGTLPDPQVLDENQCVVVDRRWTLEKQGTWMLLAVSDDGYVAMTKPGQYPHCRLHRAAGTERDRQHGQHGGCAEVRAGRCAPEHGGRVPVLRGHGAGERHCPAAAADQPQSEPGGMKHADRNGKHPGGELGAACGDVRHPGRGHKPG